MIDVVEFIDVLQNKKYGYNIRVFGCAIEAKKIKKGKFYLTNNESARLEH